MKRTEIVELKNEMLETKGEHYTANQLAYALQYLTDNPEEGMN